MKKQVWDAVLFVIMAKKLRNNMFLAGLLIGILCGFILTIRRINYKLISMYAKNPESFEAFVNKLRNKLKEACQHEGISH